MNTISPAPQQSPPSMVFLLGIITAVFILTFGAVFTLSSWAKNKHQAELSITPTPRPVTSWGTYTNVQYGFSVELPNTFSVKPISGVNGKDQVGFEFIDPSVNIGIGNPSANIGIGNGDGGDFGSVAVYVSPTAFKTTQEFYDFKKKQVASGSNSSNEIVKMITIQSNISAVEIYRPDSSCPGGLWTVNQGYVYELERIYPCRSSITNNSTLVTIANSFKFTK